jgi:hypothetical protein
MDVAMNMSKIKPGHLRCINYCRMYLNVITISDITNATGDIIETAAFEGRREDLQAPNTWNRVHQHKPDKSSWSLWRKVLRQVSYKQHQKHYLIQPLGPWIIPMANIRRAWRYWQHPRNKKLYHRSEGVIREHHKLWYDYDIDEYEVVNHIPQNAVPVDVVPNGFTLRVTPHNNTVAREETTPIDRTILEEIEHMDEWEKQLLKGMEMLTPMEEISHLRICPRSESIVWMDHCDNGRNETDSMQRTSIWI